MEDSRPDPDALVAAAAREGRGRLKVFLGAAPGVGKTYEMLAAARRLHDGGADVLIGVVETHGRAETEAQIGGLPILPYRQVPYRGQMLQEFDVDAALARRPGLLLVDELAHTNAPGSRHGQAVGGRERAAGRRHHGLGHAERAASRKPERGRGAHHRRARFRDAARPGAGGRQRGRADRHSPRRAAGPAARGPHLSSGCGRAGAGWVFQRRQPGGAAGNCGCARWRRMSTRTCATTCAATPSAAPGRRATACWRWWAATSTRWPWCGRRSAWPTRCTRPGSSCTSSAAGSRPMRAAALSLAVQLGAEVETRAGPDLVAVVLELAQRRNVTQMVIGRGRPRLWRRRVRAHAVGAIADARAGVRAAFRAGVGCDPEPPLAPRAGGLAGLGRHDGAGRGHHRGRSPAGQPCPARGSGHDLPGSGRRGRRAPSACGSRCSRLPWGFSHGTSSSSHRSIPSPSATPGTASHWWCSSWLPC